MKCGDFLEVGEIFKIKIFPAFVQICFEDVLKQPRKKIVSLEIVILAQRRAHVVEARFFEPSLQLLKPLSH